MEKFTLVSTVYNEARRLKNTLADLDAQTVKPAEVIITDAGSADGTWEILMDWKAASEIPVRLLREKGCNVARGRNLAIAEASFDLIVSTDFGCRFKPDWLKNLIAPLSDLSIDVAGGAFTVMAGETDTLAARSDHILQKGYPVVMDDGFSVSSRSIAYRKKVWVTVGGYPEWLTLAADDTIFWKLVKKHGFAYRFVASPDVYWGRHKTNRAFAREAYRYGLGDGESRINYRNFWSNLVETGMRYLLFLSLLLLILLAILSSSPGGLPVFIWFIPILFLPGLRSWINAWKSWKTVRSEKYGLKAFLNALVQLEMSRIAYLRGYLHGLSDRDPVKKEGRKKLWSVLGR
ncbi:MAG: glycosyltransferase [Bacteroidota bacterium]